jgi:hypothetical protein
MRIICKVDMLAGFSCMPIMAASSAAAEQAAQLGPGNEGIRVNQMGYLPKNDKQAFLTVTAAKTGNWHVIKACDNTTVYTGSDLGADIGYKSGLYVYPLDFSAFTEPGTYYVSGGGSKSAQFKIDSGCNNATNGANSEVLSCDWTDGWIPIANYELARVSPSHAPAAITYLANAINGLGSDKFGAAYGDNENFQWGTVGILAHKAIWGIMYNELSGTATYDSFISRQRNYIFGANPWGCSFVNGAVTSGTAYSRNCYNSSSKTGWWGEGPADHATVDAQGFAHAAPGSFDKPNCYYEDSSRNWVTNEVTIQANAEGFWLLSYYASLGAVAPVSPVSP